MASQPLWRLPAQCRGRRAGSRRRGAGSGGGGASSRGCSSPTRLPSRIRLGLRTLPSDLSDQTPIKAKPRFWRGFCFGRIRLRSKEKGRKFRPLRHLHPNATSPVAMMPMSVMPSPVPVVPVMVTPSPVTMMPAPVAAVMPTPVMPVTVMPPAHLLGSQTIDLVLRDDGRFRAAAD